MSVNWAAWLVHPILAAALLFPQAAYAEVSAIDPRDKHLYVAVQEDDVSSASGGINRYGGGFRAFQGKVRRWGFFRGQVPITEDRFLALIERSHAADDFMTVVNERRFWKSFWGWTSVGSLVLLPAAGLGVGFASVKYRTSANSYAPGEYVAVGLMVAGPLTSLAALFPYAGSYPLSGEDGNTRRPFTLDEARDAVEAYNTWVDRQ